MKNVKIILNASAAILTCGLLLFTACKKHSASEDVGYSQDQSQLEKTSDDVQNISDQAYASSNGTLSGYRTTGTTMGHCANITKDTVNRIITVDFGTTNCLCADGNYRRGQVIVKFTGHYLDNGSVHSITFNNYFVNDNQVKGSKTVTNTGTNSQGQPTFSVVVKDTIVLANNAGTISWSANRTRTFTAGYTTADWTDDTYSISGSSSLTRANGAVITSVITSPLVVALTCSWIEKGTIVFTLSNNKTATVDFGNGVCDALATVTYNGVTYNVTMRK